MSKHYAGIAFTDAVQDVQERYGSRAFYGKKAAEAVAAQPAPDPLGPGERAYLAERDGFFLASVSETGWPYVQHRGGPPGFVQVLDEHTIGWADFRGNLQHVTDGNVSQDPRVSLIVMDYATSGASRSSATPGSCTPTTTPNSSPDSPTPTTTRSSSARSW